MHEIFLQISIDLTKTYNKQDIADLLRQKSHLTGSTLSRRAQTIISWFKWIRNNLGIVDVKKDNTIQIARQLRSLEPVAKSSVNKPTAYNNRIERLIGTRTERVKVTKGWKTGKTTIAEGQRILYRMHCNSFASSYFLPLF